MKPLPPSRHADLATRRRPANSRPTAILLVILADLIACAAALAHDWASPAPGAAPSHRTPPRAPDDQARAPWGGLSWRGPSSGAPAQPNASDCRRAPTSFDVPGPGETNVGHLRAWSHERRAAASDSTPAHLSRTEPAPSTAGEPALPSDAARRRSDRLVPRPEAAQLAAKSAAPAHATAPPALAQSLPYPRLQSAPDNARPADEPVTAGVVDDNADFGEYLAFRERWAHVPRHDLVVDQRVLLDVRDARGAPVPDALVSVFAGGRPAAIWARTDAGGRAWLMAQPDAPDNQFEVRVSKGGNISSALWRRGQRDALQVRLDAARPERARLDIVFAIDATGSMADEIDKLKVSMREVADKIAQLPARPDLCFGLVAYRDRGDAFFVRGADLTNDLGAFQGVLGGLRANAGGDYAEAMNEAFHTAVHRISWRGEGTSRIVILLADAPPHLDYGAPRYDHDLRAALGRGIKVFAVGASGLDRQGEAVMRQMAQGTGGRFVFLTYDQARKPAGGPGRETVHDVRNYSVETLDKLLVRLVSEEMARWPAS